jgi:hypothetical protein
MVDAAAGPACFDPNEIFISTYHRPITVTVGLKDCWFGNAVPGRIKIINPDATCGGRAANSHVTSNMQRESFSRLGERLK